MRSYADISEAWLLGRARELVAITERGDARAQHQIANEIDSLLTETRRRATPMTFGQVLRGAVLIQLITPATVTLADPLLDELLTHARRHDLVILEAGAYALRGRRELLAGADDAAVGEVATALAMLDAPRLDRLANQRRWQRVLAAVLVDIALVLTQLGVYEVADEVMARAEAVVRSGGGPHEIAIHLLNRVRLQLSWSLRLERAGDHEAATALVATAAAMATDAEGPYRESLFPRDATRSAADQVHILAAAHALAEPDAGHLQRLRSLLAEASHPEVAFVAIALARCLARMNRTDDALTALNEARERLADDRTDRALRLSLIREFAHLSEPGHDDRAASALADYAAELEAELLAIGDSRMATLSTRREHERLARVHGTVALQALQDPLTGLPNRRALDARLAKLVALPSNYPVSIALIDLDGFKLVNDNASHAEGDDVLRVVAGTLRNALRGDDIVARYGGDEFVALLPGAPLSAAEAALARAVRKVAELPQHLSRGVTLSVGVISLRPHETAAHALARADAAMYLAKRSGGNSVAAVLGEPEPDVAVRPTSGAGPSPAP